MNRNVASLILFCAFSLCSLQPASAVTMAWSPVGNPGNAAHWPYAFGAVGYSYNIGTYDVTNSQYVEFLNSNDPTGGNPLALYNSGMSNATYGGITYNSGAASGSKYGVITGRGNNPVNYVSFYDTLRFTNWLGNNQVAGMTETGAYTLLGGTPTPSNGNSITRNAGATVFLPSEDEWFKAAYYDPNTSSYFIYPTSSNTPPTARNPSSFPNSANLYQEVPIYLTPVGVYTGTTSPYGAYDMAGNVWQWNETLVYGSSRVSRGGSFDDNPSFSASYRRNGVYPWYEGAYIGFRVASIPEPGTGLLAVLAFGLMWMLRKRFK